MKIPKPGDKVLVRTVTDHWIGEVVEFGGQAITLVKAAWIADTGRFHEFMASGRAPGMEVEPLPASMEWTVQWYAFGLWPHALFTEAV